MNFGNDVFEMLRRVAMDFGIQPLSVRMGMPAGTLYNKLNANDTTHHKPTLADFVQIVALTNDLRPIMALAAMFDGVFHRLPDVHHLPDDALLDIVNRVHAAAGDVHRDMSLALADGRVTAAEMSVLEPGFDTWLAAIVELRVRFRGMVIDPPTPLSAAP